MLYVAKNWNTHYWSKCTFHKEGSTSRGWSNMAPTQIRVQSRLKHMEYPVNTTDL